MTYIQPFRGEDIAKAAGCAKSTANLAMHKARAAVAAEADAAGTGDTGATAGVVAAGGKKDNVKGTVKVKKEEQEEDDKSTQAPPTTPIKKQGRSGNAVGLLVKKRKSTADIDFDFPLIPASTNEKRPSTDSYMSLNPSSPTPTAAKKRKTDLNPGPSAEAIAQMQNIAFLAPPVGGEGGTESEEADSSDEDMHADAKGKGSKVDAAALIFYGERAGERRAGGGSRFAAAAAGSDFGYGDGPLDESGMKARGEKGDEEDDEIYF